MAEFKTCGGKGSVMPNRKRRILTPVDPTHVPRDMSFKAEKNVLSKKPRTARFAHTSPDHAKYKNWAEDPDSQRISTVGMVSKHTPKRGRVTGARADSFHYDRNQGRFVRNETKGG